METPVLRNHKAIAMGFIDKICAEHAVTTETFSRYKGKGNYKNVPENVLAAIVEINRSLCSLHVRNQIMEMAKIHDTLFDLAMSSQHLSDYDKRLMQKKSKSIGPSKIHA